MKGSPVFASAGIWERWVNADGEFVDSYSIVTTAANAIVHEAHERMPVILPQDAYALWFDTTVQAPEEVRPLLAAYPAEEMALHPLNRRVNSVRNDDAECVKRVT